MSPLSLINNAVAFPVANSASEEDLITYFADLDLTNHNLLGLVFRVLIELEANIISYSIDDLKIVRTGDYVSRIFIEIPKYKYSQLKDRTGLDWY